VCVFFAKNTEILHQLSRVFYLAAAATPARAAAATMLLQQASARKSSVCSGKRNKGKSGKS
jgi:hypothetical protein